MHSTTAISLCFALLPLAVGVIPQPAFAQPPSVADQHDSSRSEPPPPDTSKQEAKAKRSSPKRKPDFRRKPPRRCAALVSGKVQCSRFAVEPSNFCAKHARKKQEKTPRKNVPKRRPSATLSVDEQAGRNTGEPSHEGTLWLHGAVNLLDKGSSDDAAYRM